VRPRGRQSRGSAEHEGSTSDRSYAGPGCEPLRLSLVSPLVNLQEGPMSDQTDLLQGTLDLLIMRTIAPEPLHGWAIAQRIQQISDELLRVQQGSLYPALHRLE